jgi:hypothetical protein
MFYAIAAAETLLVYGADVSNAFAEAPPPKQGFYICPDCAFNEWWIKHKNRPPIPHGHVIPVLSAMQGHPESPRLWEKHANKILCKIGLTPNVHEPCLYSGTINGQQILLMQQVDNFAIAALDERTSKILMDLIDDKLFIPIKRQGYLDMYNGVDILQTKHYIKLLVTTFIKKVFETHITTWMKTTYPMPSRSTPLPSNQKWLRKFNAAIGDPDPKIQSQLANSMQLTYQSGVGKLIWAMTTCRPDLAYTSVKLSQFNSCPHKLHFHGLKHALKFLYNSKDDAYTSGAQALVQSSQKAPSLRSIAIIKIFLLTTGHNSMHLSPMPTRIPTGQHVSKLVVLSEESVSVLQVDPLLTNVNSNQWLQDHPRKLNLQPHVTRVK